MKIHFSLVGSTIAALGISLMTISCDNKSENADSGSEPSKTDTGTAEEKPAAEEAAPTGDLESQVIGYWAPDAEAMMKEMEEQFKDSPDQLAAFKAMVAPMFTAMAVEIPEKGKVVMHMMGNPQSMSYTVKTVDEATKTLTVEITDPDGETESGSIIIGEDKLRLSGGDDGLSLVRIDEAAFKKRQEAKVPNILDLPEVPGPDAPEEAPAPEEGEKPEPAPEN